MIHHASFLKKLFLCALFPLSITQVFPSACDKQLSDETVTKKNHFTINAMEELLPCLKEKGVELGPNVAVYIDNDDTISGPRFNANPDSKGDLPLLEFLCCPDLGRTYQDVLKDAAALLYAKDDSTSLIGHKKNILQANSDVSRWNTEPWRLKPVPLELEALGAFINVARKVDTPLKICSGLPFTLNKAYFFQTHKDILGFQTCSFQDYTHQIYEANDYLYAQNKATRILQDLKKALTLSSDANSDSGTSRGHDSDIDTVILIDNAPTACTSFLKGMAPDSLTEYGLPSKTRVIAIQYDFLRKIITPEKVVSEYKLWINFLEAQRLARLRAFESDSDDGYDTNCDYFSLTASDDEDPFSDDEDLEETHLSSLPPTDDQKDQ